MSITQVVVCFAAIAVAAGIAITAAAIQTRWWWFF